MRDTITRAVNVKTLAADSLGRRTLRKAQPAGGRLILSDENIIGSLAYRPSRGPLYPDARERLTRFHGLGLADRSLTVLFGVRSYDEYLVSVYCEVLRHRPFRTFDDFFSLDDVSAISWVSVLKNIRTIFPSAPLVVWDFETFRKNPIRIVAAVGGVAQDVIGVTAPISRESMSARAIAYLVSLKGTMSDAEIRKHVGVAERTFPRAEHPPFRPFTEAAANMLRDLHREHWRQVQRSFPDATIL